jgi:hypothetical protein
MSTRPLRVALGFTAKARYRYCFRFDRERSHLDDSGNAGKALFLTHEPTFPIGMNNPERACKRQHNPMTGQIREWDGERRVGAVKLADNYPK